jgi:hypothetical protein
LAVIGNAWFRVNAAAESLGEVAADSRFGRKAAIPTLTGEQVGIESAETA